MQAVKTRFVSNFALVRWVTYVFIGGGVDASLWQVYGDFVFRIPQIFGSPLPGGLQPLAVPVFLILPLLLLIFIAPLLLSIVLTIAKPEKQLVPPLYVNLVAFGWFMAFTLIRYTSDFIVAFVLFGIAGYFGGVFLNRVAVVLLGVAVNPDDLASFSFDVQAEFSKVCAIFDSEKYRPNIGILDEDKDEKPSAVTFTGRSANRFFVRVSDFFPIVRSRITAIFYDRADWYVRPKSESLEEDAEAVSSYLKNIFSRNQMNVVEIASKPTPETEELIQMILKRMKGIIPRYEEVSKLGWAKIIAFVGAVAFIAVSAFLFQDYPTAIGLLVVIACEKEDSLLVQH